MKPAHMRKWGMRIAKEVKALIDSGRTPVLCYTGMSGVTAANAIALHMPAKYADKLAMYYVRKDGEKSHGQRVEVSGMQNITHLAPPTFIFCDDFISQGQTLVNVMTAMAKTVDRMPNVDNWKMALGWRGEFDSDIKLTGLADSLPPMRKDIAEVTRYVKYHLRRNWLLHKRVDNARRRAHRQFFRTFISGKA